MGANAGSNPARCNCKYYRNVMIKTTIPQDLEVECVDGDCFWWGKVSECDILWDQESWEMPKYWYYACPACKAPIEI